MSKYNMTTSTYVSTVNRKNFNYNTLQQVCTRMGITLTKLADSQLQSTYSMQGFIANGAKTNQVCYIFISLIQENGLPISAYYCGTLIQKAQLANQNQVAQFIKASLKIVGQNFANSKKIDEDSKQLEKLFQNLQKISQKILKSSTSQMMAVQEIKTSPQYLAVCKHATKLGQQVQNLCQKSKSKQPQSKIKNQSVLNLMLEVEEQKKLVQLSCFKYSEIVRQITDVQGILNGLIQQKKSKFNNDFVNEESFTKYLQQSIQLKRLENVKKYLSNN